MWVAPQRGPDHDPPLDEIRSLVALVGEKTRQHQHYLVHVCQPCAGKCQMGARWRVESACEDAQTGGLSGGAAEELHCGNQPSTAESRNKCVPSLSTQRHEGRKISPAPFANNAD